MHFEQISVIVCDSTLLTLKKKHFYQNSVWKEINFRWIPFFTSVLLIVYCKYHIQTIEVSVSSKSSHPGLISRWFLIFPSCLNCFLQVLSHLNIRSTMAIISLYVVPHTSILFKLLNTNITFKFRSPMGIASIYSS